MTTIAGVSEASLKVGLGGWRGSLKMAVENVDRKEIVVNFWRDMHCES